MVINRLNPSSCAKVGGALYAIAGIAIGALFSLMALAGGFGSDSPDGAGLGIMFGLGAIVVLPIIWGLSGLLGGFVGACIYNLGAGAVGGIEMDIK